MAAMSRVFSSNAESSTPLAALASSTVYAA
jgi:hypothetical protein